jgi:hypothetical protein
VTAPATPPDAATAWYVYGIVPADTPDELFEAVRGVSGSPVAVLRTRDVGAVLGRVPLSQFDGDALAENLRDAAWLEAGVRAHDAVLEAALGAGGVVPFRFGTVYRSDEHVRSMLGAERMLVGALERVRGRIELGVKGYLAAPAPPPPSAGGGEQSPGRRYLEERQRERRAAEDEEARRARTADEVHARLAALADDARANPLQPAEASGRAEPMFLNAAYLVARDHEDEFRQAVADVGDGLGADGVSLELTGPWPPYNFVEVER